MLVPSPKYSTNFLTCCGLSAEGLRPVAVVVLDGRGDVAVAGVGAAADKVAAGVVQLDGGAGLHAGGAVVPVEKSRFNRLLGNY